MSEPFDQQLARLETVHGFVRVTAVGLTDFAGHGDSVLLLTDAPQRCPEAWDLVTVLPEALKACAGRFRAGVADPEASATIAARFGVARLPALLFQRDGAWVGMHEGMLDWRQLVATLGAMLTTPSGRRPGIGIPLRAAAPTCH